jgi:phosphoribosylglycinamide formyltransferase-1
LTTRQLLLFASGTGSNARNIIEFFRNDPSVHIACIVSNKPEAGVLQIAQKEGIPTLLIEKERFFRGDAFLPEISKYEPTLLILAGFLWKIPTTLIEAFPNRILNIHPALLPKFGGKGMYGRFVHEAVKTAGETESGITIHLVDEHYDHGKTLFQASVPVTNTDSPDTIAEKIHQLEYQHFPQVIRDYLQTLPA